MLHHFFHTQNLGEVNLHIHADNCSGQNKNRFVPQYLAWRVLVGLNKNITLTFLIAVHIKFSPDWCFGLFKQAYRRTKIGCLDNIVKVVESSAVINHAQLVGTQDGQVIVPTYDWTEFFKTKCKKTAFKGIKAMHHITFTHQKTGIAIVKDSITSPEREISLLQDKNWKPTAAYLPSVTPPPARTFTGAETILVRQDQRILSSGLSGPRLSRADAGCVRQPPNT